MKNSLLIAFTLFASFFANASQQQTTPSQKIPLRSDVLKQMNLSLDKRLLMLKKSNLKEFRIEKELQKTFNESVNNFCSYYEKECDGSVCRLCIEGCYSAFYFYRKTQAEEINASKLATASKNISKGIAEKYFASFANGLCHLPKSIWSRATRPNQCSAAVLTDIQSKVIAPMIASKENEGDVCAQLPN